MSVRTLAPIIDDVLAPDLPVVFCGMAAGPKSAREKIPYIGPNNKFWPTLKSIGLIPADFRPQDFRDLPRFGIGLTDVAKTQWGADSKIVVTARDVSRLHTTMRAVRPRRIAFVGKTAASHAFGCGTKDLALGRQSGLWGGAQPWEGAVVFVLCSPSARAHSHWRPECWHALAADMRRGTMAARAKDPWPGDHTPGNCAGFRVFPD